MAEVGYIRLSRKFFSNEYWNQERAFSFAEAWLDLIYSARFEGEPAIKLLHNGRRIKIKRGEIHASLRFLAVRWGWGIDKVKRFVDYHCEKGELERRTEQSESIIKLCKYDSYNPLKGDQSNTDQYTDRYSDQYTDRTPTDTVTSTNNKKDKKDKNVNKENIPVDSFSEQSSDGQKKSVLNQKTKKAADPDPDVSRKTPTAFWTELVEIWFKFYKSKFGDDPTFHAEAGKNLKSIISKIEKSTKAKGTEWTKEIATSYLQLFLERAWNKSNWIKENFLLKNLASQFDAIKNGTNVKVNNNPVSRHTVTGRNYRERD